MSNLTNADAKPEAPLAPFEWEYYVEPESSSSADAELEVPWGGMPYNHQFTKKYVPPPPDSPPRKIRKNPRKIRNYKRSTPEYLCGGIHHLWLYDCDAPFSTMMIGPSSDLVSLCNTALKEYENITNRAYPFLRLLKAHSTSIGSCSDYDLIFQAGFSESLVETFEASVKSGIGIQSHQGIPGYSRVVKNVSMGRGSLFPHWLVGEYYTRKCVYDSDVSSPYYSVSPYATEMLVSMSQLAIQNFNISKGTNYECVQLPLRAFYWKERNTRYFDVRFLASLPQTCPKIFEAKLCKDEQTPVPWIASCYCLYGVSQGRGSLFND